MSTYNFRLPDIGEGVAEAEIVAWHVVAGSVVEEDAPLADVMTDKATVEITSPVAGKVTALGGEVGEQLPIGSVLVVFEVEGPVADTPMEIASAPAPPAFPASDAEPAVRLTDWVETRPPEILSPPVPVEQLTPALPEGGGRIRVQASPTVRERARQLGIDLADISPAVDHRIRHADLDAFLSYNASSGYNAACAPRADEQIRVIGMRRRIAENMAASKRHIPHFTYVDEIDVTKLEDLRADLNSSRGSKPKLTMLPLLITAICKAVPDFPMINARYDDEAGIVTRSGSVHLGMAAQTDAGLMVPVIRNAESLNLWQLAGEIMRLAEAARSGKAKTEELSGSTLTLSSLGPMGGIVSTPVINRPEVAIIAPNRVVERPVFRDGQVAAAKLMNLSISCDHRVVDGWDAASFVQAVKRLIETPALLFVP